MQTLHCRGQPYSSVHNMIQRAVKQGRKVISYFVYLYVHHLDISQYPSKIFFSAFHRRVSLGEGPAGQLAEDPDYDRVTRGNNRIAH